MTRRILLALAWLGLGLGFGHVAPAAAQRFGQWWWEAEVGLSGRRFENRFDGTRSRLEESNVRASFAVNGFLLHPALGRFRLGTDFFLSKIEGGVLEDTDGLGLEADFELLPRSRYPVRLFFARQLYDYASLAEADPFTLLGVPDTSTRWGGRVRFKGGPLKGALVGFDNARTDLLLPEANDEDQQSQFFDWSRLGERFQHRVRLDHRRQEFSAVDFGLRDLTLNVDERGELTAAWSWELNGTGFRREVDLPGEGATLAIGNYRLRNRLSRPLRSHDLLDLRQAVGLFRIGSFATRDEELSVFYRWRLRPAFEIAPFGQYDRQSSDDGRSLSSPRLGVTLTWTGRRGGLDSVLTSSLSYGTLEATDPRGSRSDSDFAFSFSGSLAHGRQQGLRKELEAEYFMNELRIDGAPLVDLPDLGLRRGLGSEDFLRLRLSLSHSWQTRSLGGYGEWSRRSAADPRTSGDFVAESATANLGFSASRFTVSMSYGEAWVSQELLDDQDSRFASASVTWRPWRYLRFYGSWRQDVRNLPLVADLEGDRVEGGVRLQIGQIFIEGQVFESTQELASGDRRMNRGLRWSISRALAGWLPIVTSTERRGVIR